MEQQKANLMMTHEIIQNQKTQHEEIQHLMNSNYAPKIQTNTIFEVYMRCVTWTRDSHGLFDYESKNIAKKNIKTQTGGKIIRIGDEVQLVAKSYALGPNSKPMVSLLKSKKLGDFYIKNDTMAEQSEDVDMNQKMFIVVRNTKSTDNNHDYQLCVGDVIKLGRIKFKVKNFYGCNEKDSDLEKEEIDIQHSSRNGCKICWG